MCLAAGDYEAIYRGDRVAARCRSEMVFIYTGGKWHEVSEAAIEVVYTLRQYDKDGNIKYTTEKLYHTPKQAELPIELPPEWLEV